MKKTSLGRAGWWILLGIPGLFLLGTLSHFAFDALGKSPIIGAFFPVNESVWEHLKLLLLPLILWWSLYYLFRGKKYGIHKNRWFGGALIALLSSLFAIPLLYYFYTGAFGLELMWVDILILLLALFVGQLLGLHYFRRGRGIDFRLVIVIFIALILLFALFTFYPPPLPLFKDSVSGGYGISF
ncbi:MAG: DUF6512 family protein [Oscillospiraceae bacterium]